MDLPDEINVADAADIAWAKASNNPAIWHAVAVATNAYCGDKHGFLSWLVQQPNMDRGTAGWLLLNLPGTSYLRGGDSHLHTKLPQNEFKEIMLTLCKRSETLGFAEDNIGLVPVFEDRREACLKLISDGELGANRIAPLNILNKPFAESCGDVPYEVHDGQLISTAFLRRAVPQIFED